MEPERWSSLGMGDFALQVCLVTDTPRLLIKKALSSYPSGSRRGTHFCLDRESAQLFGLDYEVLPKTSKAMIYIADLSFDGASTSCPLTFSNSL
jgi:hypothetical protein